MTIDFSKVITAEAKTEAAQAAFAETIRQAVDAHVEATAKSKGYNGAAHLASYAASSVAAWADEAAAFIAWRDSAWLTVFDKLELVSDGLESPPANAAAMIDELPTIVW